MTSVPKPLKFLRPHYGTLKEFHKNMAESDLKVTISRNYYHLLSHSTTVYGLKMAFYVSAEIAG